MSDPDETTTVGRLLGDVGGLPRWALVCLPQLSPLAESDSSLVVDSRDLEEDEDVPAIAAQLGLTRCLAAEQLQDVVENARLQLGSPAPEQLLDALNYFVLADAFISFDPDGQRC